MHKEFAFEPHGLKRLRVRYAWNIANAEVFLDGQKIAAFSSKADFQRGTTCKLPDGSTLTVRFGSVDGAPFLKGVHAVRNGVPLPGSAGDPIPKWAWIFIVVCSAIPVVSLGGALPAVIAVSGVSAVLSLARLKRWSEVVRAVACSLVAVSCWGAFGFLIVAFQPARSVHASGWNTPLSRTIFMSSSPDKLIDGIDLVLTRHGYNEKAISDINGTLRKSCEQMPPKQCVAYLRSALIEKRIELSNSGALSPGCEDGEIATPVLRLGCVPFSGTPILARIRSPGTNPCLSGPIRV